jgi:hypothetical protein
VKEHELRRLAVLVADELERRALVANTNHSGGPSAAGIAAPVGEDRCEKDMNESMDPTIEATERSDGASSSPALTAARLLSRSRQRPKRNVLPLRPASRAKAER